MALETLAEEYFSKINPIAAKMYADMNETKLAYEEMWKTFSNKEQKDILSESIIKPEISVKYLPLSNTGQLLSEEYATKVVIDDNCTYRDEHSGPFSFKTKSQRDLYNFCRNDDAELINKSTLNQTPQSHQTVFNNVMHKEFILDRDSEQSSSLLDDSEECFISTNTITPKTGLDFLDNW